jgi:hypothetical protein
MILLTASFILSIGILPYPITLFKTSSYHSAFPSTIYISIPELNEIV